MKFKFKIQQYQTEALEDHQGLTPVSPLQPILQRGFNTKCRMLVDKIAFF